MDDQAQAETKKRQTMIAVVVGVIALAYGIAIGFSLAHGHEKTTTAYKTPPHCKYVLAVGEPLMSAAGAYAKSPNDPQLEQQLLNEAISSATAGPDATLVDGLAQCLSEQQQQEKSSNLPGPGGP
jgi:hypothetical protein